MPYSAELIEVLKKFSNGNTYKVLQLKITIDNGKFVFMSSGTDVTVTDGTNSVSALGNGLSGNQKHLEAYFTTDAFAGFSSNSTIKFGQSNSNISDEITGFNPSDINLLPSFINTPTYTDLDNLTLSNL